MLFWLSKCSSLFLIASSRAEFLAPTHKQLLPKQATHTLTNSQKGAIGYQAEKRKFLVGLVQGARVCGCDSWSLGEPGATGICQQHFSLYFCECEIVCVCRTADVIELFIDFHFNRKKDSSQAGEEILGLGRRARRPTDVSRGAAKDAIKGDILRV